MTVGQIIETKFVQFMCLFTVNVDFDRLVRQKTIQSTKSSKYCNYMTVGQIIEAKFVQFMCHFTVNVDFDAQSDKKLFRAPKVQNIAII